MKPGVLIVGLLAVVLFLLAPSAQAHYKDDKGRWEFFGGTYSDRLGNHLSDPVNIFWYPRAHTCTTDNCNLGARVQAHLKQHWRPKWEADDEISAFPYCKGSQYMDFRGLRGYYPETSQGVGYVPGNQPTASVPDECGNRYHSRLWSDRDEALDEHPSEAKRWLVGNIHHERVVVKFLLKGLPRIEGHTIDIDWDLVEFAAVKKMRRDPLSSEHRDPAGRPGGHCTDFRWKALPGSSGPLGGRYRRQSDGLITRISLNHCP